MRGLVQAGVFLFLLASKLSFAQSKIVLTSRSFHPKDETDRLNTQEAYNNFHAEQIDWMYCTDDRKLMSLRSNGITYSLAINPQVPDSLQYTTVKTRMVDIKGQPYIAPWMKTWKIKNPYWGCVNNPSFQNLFLKKSIDLVSKGAYGIFVDDARFNDHALDWGGGCFCKYCITGFSQFVKENGTELPPKFDYKHFLLSIDDKRRDIKKERSLKLLYKNYQRESVVNFLRTWKRNLQHNFKRKIIFLTNNFNGEWSEIYKIFDVGIAELKVGSDVTVIDSALSRARKLNKKQIFSYGSSDIAENLKFYLYSYLKNGEALIPWDVKVSDSQDMFERFYVTSGEIEPLLKFIRKYRSDFDLVENDNTFLVNNPISNNVLALRLKASDGNSYCIVVERHSSKRGIEFHAPTGDNSEPILYGGRSTAEGSTNYVYHGFAVYKTNLN